MKRFLPILGAFLFASGLSASADPLSGPLWFAGDDATVAPLCSRSFYDVWLADRLSIGLRLSHASLTDGDRPASYEKDFIGAINKLDDDDELSLGLEIRYWTAPYLLLTFGWDHVAGRTRNFNTPNHHSDGTATLSGPVLLAEGLLPLMDEKLLLHAGPGIAYGSGGFDHVTWWRLGYSDAEGWRQSGSPSSGARGGRYREIQVDDAFGLVLSAGVAWRITDRAELDFSIRHVWIEPDVCWGYRSSGKFYEEQKGEFTMDHLSVSAMLSWVF